MCFFPIFYLFFFSYDLIEFFVAITIFILYIFFIIKIIFINKILYNFHFFIHKNFHKLRFLYSIFFTYINKNYYSNVYYVKNIGNDCSLHLLVFSRIFLLLTYVIFFLKRYKRIFLDYILYL